MNFLGSFFICWFCFEIDIGICNGLDGVGRVDGFVFGVLEWIDFFGGFGMIILLFLFIFDFLESFFLIFGLIFLKWEIFCIILLFIVIIGFFLVVIIFGFLYFGCNFFLYLLWFIIIEFLILILW